MSILSSESQLNQLTGFNRRLDKKMARLNTIAGWHKDIFEDTQGNVELPWDVNDVYLHATKYVEDNYKDVDAEATIEYLSMIVKYAVSRGFKVAKDYSYKFMIKITLPVVGYEDETVEIEYVANREAVCTKKVVGVKHHEEQVTPAHDEEIVEWECEKISFLS